MTPQTIDNKTKQTHNILNLSQSPHNLHILTNQIYTTTSATTIHIHNIADNHVHFGEADNIPFVNQIFKQITYEQCVNVVHEMVTNAHYTANTLVTLTTILWQTIPTTSTPYPQTVEKMGSQNGPSKRKGQQKHQGQ